MVWLWVHFGPATTGVVRARGGMGVRRCPTLPHGPPCSTIGAVRLSFRVRNVSGRFPHAMAAVTASICSIMHSLGRSPGAGWSCSRSWIENRMVDANSVQDGHTRVGVWCCQVLGLLVPVSSTPRGASTSGLSTQWSAGVLSPRRAGKSHLEAGFPLRCFQRLSIPNVANQPCSWRNNWHTRGWSISVLSY